MRRIRKNVIAVPVFGGLGNQIFQLAFALYAAEKYSRDILYLDFTKLFGQPREYEIGVLDAAPCRTSPHYLKSLFFALRAWGKLCQIAGFSSKRILLDRSARSWEYCSKNTRIAFGYWQDIDLALSQRQRLIALFNSAPFANDSLDQEILSTKNAVAVHVRRGDFVSNPIATGRHLVCDESYYLEAIKAVKAKVKNPVFFVFSDDIEWTQVALKSVREAVFVDRKESSSTFAHSALCDLQSMRLCGHHIISNSTYSWWAAVLSEHDNSVTICPSEWFRGVKTVDSNMYHESWTLL